MRVAIPCVIVLELCRGVSALPDGLAPATCERSAGNVLLQGSTVVARKALFTAPQADSVRQNRQASADPDRSNASDSMVPLALRKFWRRTTPLQRLGLVLICVALFGLKLAILFWGAAKVRSAGSSAAADELARMEQARGEALAKLEELDVQLRAMQLEVSTEKAETNSAAAAAPSDAPALTFDAKLAAVADGAVGQHPLRFQLTDNLENASAKVGRLRAEDMGAKAEELQQAIAAALRDARGSAEVLAEEAAKATSNALQEAINAEVPETEVAEFRRTAREAVAPLLAMPVPMLFAGLIAPAQIQVLCSFNWLMLCLQLPALALLSAGAAADYGRSCGSGTLWTWSLGMIAISGVSLVLRAWVLAGTRAAMRDVHDHQKSEPSSLHGHVLAGHQHASKLDGAMRLLSMSSGDYFRALLAYDNISRAWLQTALTLLCGASLLWGVCGILAMTMIVLPEEQHCEATMMRLAANVYGFVFVASALWSVLALFLWVLFAMLTNEKAALSALRGAIAFDEMYSPSSLPVASLVLQGTILRSPSDTVVLETNELLADIANLRQQKGVLDEQETSIDGDLASSERQLRALEARREQEGSYDVASQFSTDLASAIDSAAFVGMTAKGQLAVHEADLAEMSASATSALSEVEDERARCAQDMRASAANAEKTTAEVAQQRERELEEKAKQQLSQVDIDGMQQKAQAAAEELAVSALAKAKAQGVDIEKLSGEMSQIFSQSTGLACRAVGSEEAAPGG